MRDIKNYKIHEIESVLKLCEHNLKAALQIYEHQLNVLQTRAQVLMGLAGVVLSITGFSGHRIASTGRIAQFSVILGLGTVLISAVWVWKKVMNVRWITDDLYGTSEEILSRIIDRRNAKTAAYVKGGYLLCAGFSIYSVAFAMMLLFFDAVSAN